MTPDGITPMQNKVEAVLKLGRPMNKTQDCSLLVLLLSIKACGHVDQMC